MLSGNFWVEGDTRVLGYNIVLSRLFDIGNSIGGDGLNSNIGHYLYVLVRGMTK